MIKPDLGFVLLFVKNPAESAKFYSSILNLKPVDESPTFVLFRLSNGVMLGLWSHETAEPKVTAQPGAAEIAFGADNVDDLHAAWKYLGVVIAQEPTEMDFGRTFVALDPDGHRVRVYKLRQELQSRPYRN